MCACVVNSERWEGEREREREREGRECNKVVIISPGLLSSEWCQQLPCLDRDADCRAE